MLINNKAMQLGDISRTQASIQQSPQIMQQFLAA